MSDYRQLIIARKDLGMSAGKLSAQVAHASNAFMTKWFREHCDDNGVIQTTVFEKDIFNNWINGIFTKTVCEAKNRNQLMKAITIANELGLEEGEDFWLIKDNCLTELEPEEIDENGVGRTLTCIGFKPMPTETVHLISKKIHLYM